MKDLGAATKDNKKLTGRIAMLEAQNKRLRSAKGREDLLGEEQAKVAGLEDELRGKEARIAELSVRMKQSEEFCDSYKAIARDTTGRQMNLHSLGMKCFQVSNGHLLDLVTKMRLPIPVSTYDAGEDIPMVNGDIDLFVESKMKRKTCTGRRNHGELFCNSGAREEVSRMNPACKQAEANKLVNRVVAIAGRHGHHPARITSVQYVKFEDVTVGDFEAESIVPGGQILDIHEYRRLFGRIWYDCYKTVLLLQDIVCLIRFTLLPDIPP